MSKKDKRLRTILKRMSILGEIPSPEVARRYGIEKQVQAEIDRREAIRLAEEAEKQKAEEKKAEEERKKREGIKTVQCSGIRSNGQRCGLTTETKAKTWKCMHHMEFSDGMDRDGDGLKEYRFTAIKTNGQRCNNKTENKNKKCYAHQ